MTQDVPTPVLTQSQIGLSTEVSSLEELARRLGYSVVAPLYWPRGFKKPQFRIHRGSHLWYTVFAADSKTDALICIGGTRAPSLSALMGRLLARPMSAPHLMQFGETSVLVAAEHVPQPVLDRIVESLAVAAE